MKISEIKSSCTFEESAIALLTALPDDEVLTIQELADRLRRRAPTNDKSCPRLKTYRLKVSLRRISYVYGNPKALRALRKKLAL